MRCFKRKMAQAWGGGFDGNQDQAKEIVLGPFNRLLNKVRKTSESVIPAKAGIQHITDFFCFNILDPGFRRGDEEFFINLL